MWKYSLCLQNVRCRTFFSKAPTKQGGQSLGEEEGKALILLSYQCRSVQLSEPSAFI